MWPWIVIPIVAAAAVGGVAIAVRASRTSPATRPSSYGAGARLLSEVAPGPRDPAVAVEVSEALQEAVDAGAVAAPLLPGTMVSGIASVEGDIRLQLRDREVHRDVELLLTDELRPNTHVLSAYAFTDAAAGVATTGEVVMPGFQKPDGSWTSQRLPHKRWPDSAYGRPWALKLSPLPLGPDVGGGSSDNPFDMIVRSVITIHRSTPPAYIMAWHSDSDEHFAFRQAHQALQKRMQVWSTFIWPCIKGALSGLMDILGGFLSGGVAGAILGFVDYAMTSAVSSYQVAGQDVPRGLRMVAHAWAALPVYELAASTQSAIATLQAQSGGLSAAAGRLFSKAVEAGTSTAQKYVKAAVLAGQAKYEAAIADVNAQLQTKSAKFRVLSVNGVMDWRI